MTLTGEALVRWKYQRYMQDYLATVQSVDDNVGRLLDFLDGQGLAKNTIVVYTSDQGFFLGDHGLFDKRFMYEESLRMPFLVRWPAASSAGTRSHAIALNVDFAPTFLDAAGIAGAGRHAGPQPPAAAARPGARRLAHVDVLPLLPRPRRPQHARALRRAHRRTHKLIYFWKKDQWELFDLVNDPNELHNLYGEPGQEELTATLKARAPAAEAVGPRRRPVRERAAAERRRRPGGEAARQVSAPEIRALRRRPRRSGDQEVGREPRAGLTRPYGS